MRRPRGVSRVVPAVAGLAAWELVAVVGVRNRLLFPPVEVVVSALVAGFRDGVLTEAIIATLARALSAFLAGCVFGIPSGFLLGSVPWIRATLEGPADFLRSLPVSAIIPALVILLGTSDLTRVAAAAWACTLVILTNTLYGASTGARTRHRVARLFGASPWQEFKTVRFWEALPQVLAGMRVAVSLAVVYTILSEILIVSKNGLGRTILDSALTYDTGTLYAAIFMSGVLGLGLNRLLLLVEGRMAYW